MSTNNVVMLRYSSSETDVTGTTYGGVTSYMNDAQFRAWGAPKNVQYGSGYELLTTYTNSLQAENHITRSISTPSAKILDKDYEYFKDGNLRLIDDNKDYQFSRSFTYDHAGRVKQAKSGVEATGGTETDLANLPYRQTYTYNAFNQITERDSTIYDHSENSWDYSYTITNNKTTAFNYDVDKRLTSGEGTYFVYDASGAMTRSWKSGAHNTNFKRDGNGREVTRLLRVWDPEEEELGEEWC